MCGIAGIINFNGNPVNRGSLALMLQEMKHRGPDDEGIYISDNIGLGHVRLSIIDLSQSGHQPFHSTDGRYVIVYNGEIYNYVELREQLQVKGYEFNSKTDTEVLLNSFIEWGEDCLDKLNGMWAFVIYDSKSQQIFGARDRYGIKPFYYYYNGSSFIFASDIPPILNQLKSKPDPNRQIIFDFLAFGRTDHNEETFFSQIKKIQHGHCLLLNVKTNNFTIKRWYYLPEKIKAPFLGPEEFLEAMQTSIALRLRSDVPVGVCLSGGIDSSSIVSLLTTKLEKSKINTFSAVYNLKHRADEKEFIDKVDATEKNYTVPTQDDFFRDIPRLIKAQSEPFPSSAIYAQFKVMELAKNHVTVLLDGQGADEYLAGYHYFFGYYFLELLNSHKYLDLINEISEYIRNYSFGIGIKYFIYLLAPKHFKEKIVADRSSLLKKSIITEYIKSSKIINDLQIARSVNEACLNHFEYKLEHLLKWEDRNSMFFSLESRIPFLDFNIVERIIGGPTEQKIHKGWTKSILRESMEGYLNNKIRLRRDKVGFATPEEIWLKSKEFNKLFLEAVCSEGGIISEFIDRNDIRFKMKLLSKNPRNFWKWINLYLWEKQFYNN